MNKQVAYGIALLAILGVVIAALGYALQPQLAQGNPVVLSEVFDDSTAFRFAYPDGWRHQIPQQNILFLASPEVLQGEIGATITIQRSLRLSTEADSLDAALDFYLERGPLRSDRAWSVVDERKTVVFSSRDALQITLEGSEIVDTTPMRSVIFITRANNNLIYVFTISAPIEQWDEIEPTLTAIGESVVILE